MCAKYTTYLYMYRLRKCAGKINSAVLVVLITLAVFGLAETCFGQLISNDNINFEAV